MASDYIHIGKIAATHGITGEVIVQHVLNKKIAFGKIEALFIEEQKGSYIPYFIEKSKGQTLSETICKLEGIESKESAHRFIKKNVWLTKDDFEKIADNNSPLSLIDYLVYDEETPLSKVEEVIEQPHQVLLKIFMEGKEILLPLHQETLNSVDRKNKKVYLSLPDGLLDIYMNE